MITLITAKTTTVVTPIKTRKVTVSKPIIETVKVIEKPIKEISEEITEETVNKKGLTFLYQVKFAYSY